ncbi:MAG: hypothetical protein RSB97_08475 [Christensenella sp.]
MAYAAEPPAEANLQTANAASAAPGAPLAAPSEKPGIISHIVVTEYKVINSASVSQIRKESKVSIELTLKNSGIKTSADQYLSL